jgi:hypothetical protein
MAFAFDYPTVPMQAAVVAGRKGFYKTNGRRHKRLRTTNRQEKPYREILMVPGVFLVLSEGEVAIPRNYWAARQIPQNREGLEDMA